MLIFKKNDFHSMQQGLLYEFGGNISEKELRSFKKLAKRYLVMTNEQLANAVKIKELIEIKGA